MQNERTTLIKRACQAVLDWTCWNFKQNSRNNKAKDTKTNRSPKQLSLKLVKLKKPRGIVGNYKLSVSSDSNEKHKATKRMAKEDLSHLLFMEKRWRDRCGIYTNGELWPKFAWTGNSNTANVISVLWTENREIIPDVIETVPFRIYRTFDEKDCDLSRRSAISISNAACTNSKSTRMYTAIHRMWFIDLTAKSFPYMFQY